MTEKKKVKFSTIVKRGGKINKKAAMQNLQLLIQLYQSNYAIAGDKSSSTWNRSAVTQMNAALKGIAETIKEIFDLGIKMGDLKLDDQAKELVIHTLKIKCADE